MEGVAHREHGGLEVGLLELLDGRFDCFRRSTDDRLGRRVDVGDDDVAVGLGNDSLDLGERCEHGRHRPVVLDREIGHLPAAGADRLERR